MVLDWESHRRSHHQALGLVQDLAQDEPVLVEQGADFQDGQVEAEGWGAAVVEVDDLESVEQVAHYCQVPGAVEEPVVVSCHQEQADGGAEMVAVAEH